MFTNWRRFLFVSINAFVKVAASITNISCIAQVTLKLINLTLLVNNGWLDFSKFKVLVEFSADEHGLNKNDTQFVKEWRFGCWDVMILQRNILHHQQFIEVTLH